MGVMAGRRARAQHVAKKRAQMAESDESQAQATPNQGSESADAKKGRGGKKKE